ncbi:MAG: hypothetical protein WCZ23_17590, partial [Rhodospirillaceae bacterium]
TMFQGMRLYWKRAAAIGLTNVVVVVGLLVNIWFYAYSGIFVGQLAWLGYVIALAAVWAVVFLGLMNLFTLPALVQKRVGWWATVKLAALLTLDNPMFAIGLAVQLGAVTVVAVLAPPVLVFLHGGIVAVTVGCAYEMLARKYARIETQRQAAAAGTGGHTTTLSRGRRGPTESDEDDDYLNRGFRDFLFPWKG